MFPIVAPRALHEATGGTGRSDGRRLVAVEGMDGTPSPWTVFRPWSVTLGGAHGCCIVSMDIPSSEWGRDPRRSSLLSNRLHGHSIGWEKKCHTEIPSQLHDRICGILLKFGWKSVLADPLSGIYSPALAGRTLRKSFGFEHFHRRRENCGLESSDSRGARRARFVVKRGRDERERKNGQGARIRPDRTSERMGREVL